MKKLKSNWKESGKVYQSIDYEGFSVDGFRNKKSVYRRLRKMGFYDTVKKEHSVLDIGCNLGAICLEAHSVGCSRIVGIDKKEIINDAKTIQKHVGANRISYVPIEITKENLPKLFEDVTGRFDHVFAMAVMMYMPEKVFWKVVRHYIGDNLWFETNHRPKEKRYLRLFSKYVPKYKVKQRIKMSETDAKGKHTRIVYHLVKNA